MLDIDTLFLFCFIFSVLIVSRTCFRFISTLLLPNPTKMIYNGRELLMIGITISYIITYLIKT